MRELTVGQYSPTEAFKKIQNHSCVCYSDDMGLVALTGPADDLDSQNAANLFAYSPKLVDQLKVFLDLCPRVSEMEPMAGALSDACADTRELLKAMLVEGRTEKPEFPFGEFDNGKHWQGEA